MDWNVFFINSMETVFAKLSAMTPLSLPKGYDRGLHITEWNLHFVDSPGACCFTSIVPCNAHNSALRCVLLLWHSESRKVLSNLPKVLKLLGAEQVSGLIDLAPCLEFLTTVLSASCPVFVTLTYWISLSSLYICPLSRLCSGRLQPKNFHVPAISCQIYYEWFTIHNKRWY